MLCPYCSSDIKGSSSIKQCPVCKTMHHLECWEYNKGCAVSDCPENHQKHHNSVDIGNVPFSRIKEMLKGKNETGKSGKTSDKTLRIDDEFTESPEIRFENEFRGRYNERAKLAFRRKILMFSSLFFFFSVLVLAGYFGITKLYTYFNSEEYKITLFVNNWKKSWETKDIFKFKEFLDEEYQYIESDSKPVSYDERVKKIAATFDNYKFIKLKFTDIRITFDSLSATYANVTFTQEYKSDKKEETGKKRLRLYRGSDGGNKWKIFREYYDPE